MDYLKSLFTKLDEKHKCVHTSDNIPAHTIILNLKGKIMSTPNVYSIQLGAKKHLNKGNSIDDYLNHSCEPNCAMDIHKMALVSIQNINAGDELTINYCATEEKLANPFICLCGSLHCYGVIKGFDYLNRKQKKRLYSILSPYLKAKVGLIK